MHRLVAVIDHIPRSVCDEEEVTDPTTAVVDRVRHEEFHEVLLRRNDDVRDYRKDEDEGKAEYINGYKIFDERLGDDFLKAGDKITLDHIKLVGDVRSDLRRNSLSYRVRNLIEYVDDRQYHDVRTDRVHFRGDLVERERQNSSTSQKMLASTTITAPMIVCRTIILASIVYRRCVIDHTVCRTDDSLTVPISSAKFTLSVGKMSLLAAAARRGPAESHCTHQSRRETAFTRRPDTDRRIPFMTA